MIATRKREALPVSPFFNNKALPERRVKMGCIGTKGINAMSQEWLSMVNVMTWGDIKPLKKQEPQGLEQNICI